MSAAGIKVATTTTTPNPHTAAAAAAAVDDVNDRINTKATTSINENDSSTSLDENVADNSSFCNLPSLKEQQALSSSPSASSLGNDDGELTQNNKVPLENSQQTTENEAEINDDTQTTGAAATSIDVFNNELNNKCHGKKVEDAVDNTQLSPGLSLLQQTAAASSPPPHSYRHSRAYRHFKNPPQPHMCIRTTTEGGEELFINVLSWTRIVIPQEPSDPIPLYGGMRVPPGSPRSPPIVFAVMANPEVLKDSGRHSKDPEERRAMVELMCDFVEAMNPGVKLVRNAVILKDRDISGELKDVWNAVQAQRDREREEQLILQRQQHQQHFHNMTNATTNGNSNPQLATNHNNSATTQQMFPKAGNGGSEAILMAVDGIGTPPRSRKLMHEVQTDNNTTSNNIDIGLEGALDSQMSLALLAEHLDNKIAMGSGEQTQQQQNEENHMQKQNNQNCITNDALSNGNNSKNSITQERGSNKMDINNQLNMINCNKPLTNGSSLNCNQNDTTKTINATSTPSNNTVNNTPALNSTTTTTSSANTNSQTTSVTTTSIPTPAPAPAPVPVQQAPTKKEKLGGFLPNGCIFPRFTKNNKHKDKDKEKEKETKSKDKEKNVLLSALKKSKDKKSSANAAAAATAAAATAVANLNQDDKNTSSNSNNITTANNCNNKQQQQQQQKNCLQQLESGVQKLDINNHQQQLHTHIQDKNINNSNAANNSNNATTNNITGSGVGVH